MSDLTGAMFLTVRRDGRTLSPVKVTSRVPTVVDADSVVIRVRVVVPESAFKPLVSETVTVQSEHVVTTAGVRSDATAR
jgi:hypothetical protein